MLVNVDDLKLSPEEKEEKKRLKLEEDPEAWLSNQKMMLLKA